MARELPMEYTLELNRLIELQMKGAVGQSAGLPAAGHPVPPARPPEL